MSKFDDKTTMGGEIQRFHTTCWTKISDVKISDKAKEQIIINELIGSYWKPVYCYLRHKGNIRYKTFSERKQVIARENITTKGTKDIKGN